MRAMQRKPCRSVVSVSVGACLMLAWVGSAAGQVTELLSAPAGGAPANSFSFRSSMSADGRYVAFESFASNLVPGDGNGTWDIFVLDRQSATIELVSRDTGGVQGNGASQNPSLSADGRYVAFESDASNLVAGDTNGWRDIFVHDRQGGTTVRVSVSTLGAQASDSCVNPSISGNGRYVAFESWSGSLVSGDANFMLDVFLHDRQTGITELVSLDSGGSQGNNPSASAAVSANGRYVAFESAANNLVAGDTNGDLDVFVRDRQSGTTERVSVSTGGAQGNAESFSPTISANGRYVAFESLASTLVAGDSNGAYDIFVHDRGNGITERVSVDSGGAQSNGNSSFATLSGDGRYVAFRSDADNLVGTDTNAVTDVFVHDRHSGGTERVSVDSGGAEANGFNESPSISSNGRYVSFRSNADNLVPGDTNMVSDVFLRDRQSGIGWSSCIANPNSTGSAAGLSVSGSASSAAGDLTLSASPVPDQSGLMFHGANLAQLPFGDGYLCTQGGIVRGAVVMGSGAVATYTYDNSGVLRSLAAFVGSTRHFQYWFRDTAAAGAGFNTSTALTITIEP